MKPAVRAAIAYFAIVFAAGFLMGVFRVTLVEPRLGAMTAVLLEAPVMLAASWFACRGCLQRFQVSRRINSRAAMAAISLALLVGAEILLGEFLFGRSLGEMAQSYGTSSGLVGLAAQLAFAALPLIAARTS